MIIYGLELTENFSLIIQTLWCWTPSQACQTWKHQRSPHLVQLLWWEVLWHLSPCPARLRVWCPSPHSAATAAPSCMWETRSLSQSLVSVGVYFLIEIILNTQKLESAYGVYSSNCKILSPVWLNPVALIPSTEIIEDVAESPAPPALPVSVVSPPSQEKEAYKRLGLTKQVLAAHTQKEEQAFLIRCRELLNTRTFQKDGSPYLHKQRGPANTEGTRGLLKQFT